MGLGAEVQQAELKLLAALPSDWQHEAKRISSRFHLDPAGWFQPGYVHAHLKAVADAVWAERKLSVRYESWTKTTDRVLEPFGLVLKGGIWYVVARSADEVRTFRLSGIKALITLDETFARPKAFDLVAYWAEATEKFQQDIYVGTARVRATQRGIVRLKGISETVRKAIEAEELIYDAGGWTTLTIPIEEIGWATREMTNVGAEAEVLAPPELRTAVAEVARKMAALYA
jgi:predicted DNA-binding transcriptional regulator YafY